MLCNAFQDVQPRRLFPQRLDRGPGGGDRERAILPRPEPPAPPAAAKLLASPGEIRVHLSGLPLRVVVGEELWYTITVTNAGDTELQAPRLIETRITEDREVDVESRTLGLPPLAPGARIAVPRRVALAAGLTSVLVSAVAPGPQGGVLVASDHLRRLVLRDGGKALDRKIAA